MGWLYFALMGLLAILLGAFGSVFTTYSGLYLAKDNDLLLSLPIPVNTLIAARLLGVYLMGLMYSGVVMLPAIIVYWVDGVRRPAAPCIGGRSAPWLLISMFVLTLSCAAGLGGGEDQPEAEKQKLRHRGGVAGVHRPVLLLLLLQGQTVIC